MDYTFCAEYACRILSIRSNNDFFDPDAVDEILSIDRIASSYYYNSHARYARISDVFAIECSQCDCFSFRMFLSMRCCCFAGVFLSFQFYNFQSMKETLAEVYRRWWFCFAGILFVCLLVVLIIFIIYFILGFPFYLVGFAPVKLTTNSPCAKSIFVLTKPNDWFEAINWIHWSRFY